MPKYRGYLALQHIKSAAQHPQDMYHWHHPRSLHLASSCTSLPSGEKVPPSIMPVIRSNNKTSVIVGHVELTEAVPLVFGKILAEATSDSEHELLS